MNARCPHCQPFRVGGSSFSAEEIIEKLGPCIVPERRLRLQEVIAQRTYTVVPVLDGLYDHGNVNAVIRSAEALGYQALHQIDSSPAFKRAKRVSQGADKWLDIEHWAATGPCIDRLKRLGYRIVATHFEDARPIHEFDFTQPTAVVFGNEHEGVSQAALSAADDRMVIPMTGFTRSFNISVAAALCLYHIREARQRILGLHGDLTPDEQRGLTASYYLRSVTAAESILLEERKKGKGEIPAAKLGRKKLSEPSGGGIS